MTEVIRAGGAGVVSLDDIISKNRNEATTPNEENKIEPDTRQGVYVSS